MLRLMIICLLIIVCAQNITCTKFRQENPSSQLDENASGKRTLVIGKFLLLPILAGVGIKFLVLLPIILSKIALLGILSFVSSNLSLLVSAVMGIRSYFFEDKGIEDEYDHDGYHQNRYESHYAGHKDPNEDRRHHDNDQDFHFKHMNLYKGHESSHAGSNHHHPEYRDHDKYKDSTKRFRPFKLLGRIKDAIKDHFHKSEGYRGKHREYDYNYRHDPHDSSDDHNEYSHTVHEAKYKGSDHPIINHGSAFKDKYYAEYNVPEDWSQKDEIRSNRELFDVKNQHYAISEIDGEYKIALENNVRALLTTPANLNLAQTTEGYKVYENIHKSTESSCCIAKD